MFLKYNGLTKNFKYKDIDFSKGPAEVDDEEGKEWIKNNPRTFTHVVPVTKVDEKADEKVKVRAAAKAKVSK